MYKRLLLKLSGELLVGSHQSFGIHLAACHQVAQSIKILKDKGFELAIVMGGGNIFRGINLKDLGMPRTPADQMGMLATLINGIALQQALLQVECPAILMSALDCPRVAEPYNWVKAIEQLAANKIVIFVGGTGNPYFTTDTAAALRASEIQADILMKATKVAGVYDKDPLKYTDATLYSTLTYSQFLAQKLEVMDATAVAMCRNSKIPILVFDMSLLEKGKILETWPAHSPGTLIKGE